MKIIEEKLIDFSNTRKDPIGDIYEYEGKMVRLVSKQFRHYVEQLMNSPLIAKLLKEKFLVDTCISEYTYGENGLVLEHKKITPPQTASQWTFTMMNDVAKLVLQINQICMEHGYELKDCHQANFLFDGVRPVLVDFGSIVKRGSQKGWTIKDEFLERYFYPLKLWSRNYDKTIDALMQSTMKLDLTELMRIYYGVPERVVRGLLFTRKFFQLKATVEMKALYSRINGIKYQIDTQWGNYQDRFWGKNNKRFDYEIEWINKMSDINTMIELGANQGYFSYLVSKNTKVKKIISTDYDKKAVDVMYQRLKRQKSRNVITPLLLDFVWMPIEKLKKYQSDLVVANALTHHLILTQGMSQVALTERLAVLGKKYVIVEFMPYGVGQSKLKLPEWYTEDNFMSNLRARFTIVNIFRAEKRRTIIIGVNNNYKEGI